MRISRVVGPQRSEISEVPDVAPAPNQVLVDVLACGVCTSDRGAWTHQTESADPLTLGHEIVGRIRSVGSPSLGWVPGTIVTGLAGNGFASLAVMNATDILPVPAGMSPELALGEPLACLVEALSRCPVSRTDRVAVVGLGFMGLGLVQLLRERGVRLIVGVDPSPDARAHAIHNGADEVYAPEDVPEEYREATTGPHEERMDLVLEVTGVTPGLATAGALVRPYGTMCIVGYHYAGDAKLDMGLWYKAVTVVNGFSPDRRRTMAAMKAGLDLVATHRFDYAPLITHRFGLDEVDAAFDLMSRRDSTFVKSVVIP
jgi:L-iditol 2-dehydrogenase